MERYAEYSESGAEWIGEVPKPWAIKKIKHGSFVKGRIGWKGLKSDEFLEYGYSFLITGTDFKDGKIEWKSCYHIDQERYEEDPYIQVFEGDLLITKDGTIGKTALAKDLKGFACLNSGIFLIRPTNGMYTTQFLYWILNSNTFTSFNDYTKSGSTISHLYQNVFVEFSFPVPPFPEQTAIASFLDRKTKLIDDLIAKKERLIELKKEERAAIINQAVTKGLDPTVPMKDSGIEWLGEVPEGWEVKKLKLLTLKIGDGIHTTPNYVDESEYYFVNGNNFDGGVIRVNKNTRAVDESEFQKHKIDLSCNTVMFSINGTIGKLAFYNGEKVVFGKSAAYLDCNNLLFKFFLYYLLQSDYVKTFFENSLSSTTIKNLSLNTLENTKVAFPNHEEQEKIVEYIQHLSEFHDMQKSRLNKQIDLLKEYKTSLISEAVTGKIKII